MRRGFSIARLHSASRLATSFASVAVNGTARGTRMSIRCVTVVASPCDAIAMVMTIGMIPFRLE